MKMAYSSSSLHCGSPFFISPSSLQAHPAGGRAPREAAPDIEKKGLQLAREKIEH
jgi:hypothetical protein